MGRVGDGGWIGSWGLTGKARLVEFRMGLESLERLRVVPRPPEGV